MKRLFFSLLALGCLAGTPRFAAAQEGGLPVKPAPNTQYVLQNGAVVQRLNGNVTPLDRNIRLPNGTKVNVKSGIIELPGGKMTSLREGDYVKADGGIVFATPSSAAAAQGDNSVPATARYDTYVQTGTASPNAGRQIQLLQQKAELLNRKVELLQRSQPAVDTGAIDQQLREIDGQLRGL